MFQRVKRTDNIALSRLAELLFVFLTDDLSLNKELCAQTIWGDYQRGTRREKPEFLRPYIDNPAPVKGLASDRSGLRRQARHLAS